MPAALWALSLAVARGESPAYAKDVAPIMRAKCERCHQPNDIAPFGLQTYEQAATWAADIERVVKEGIMPPWKPSAGYGAFRDNFGLTEAERETLLQWVAAGTPLGDPELLPPPLEPRTSIWELGEPDAVLRLPKYSPPRGPDKYRCFSLPLNNETTQYLSGVQFAPGDRRVVHHVILFLDGKGESAAMGGEDGQPGWDCYGGPGFGSFSRDGSAPLSAETFGQGGVLGAWAPGSKALRQDTGLAFALPPQSRVVVQIHYHTAGRYAEDESQVGLYFTPREQVTNRLITLGMANRGFLIPPDEADYLVRAERTLTAGITGKIVQVFPHQHQIGTSIRTDLVDAQGESRPLIHIARWDFNWQGFYTFVEPVPLRRGTVLRTECRYDNSAGNPNNPSSPPAPVGWGEQTTDEMCVLGFTVILDNERALLGPLP